MNYMTEKTTKKSAKATTASANEAPKAEKAKETKTESKTPVAKVVKVKKFIQFVKKIKPKKSTSVKELQKNITENKKDHPVFRGRFGKRQFRRISIKKWDKWRKPHGIDLDKGLNHGRRPKTGYKNSSDIRGVHPSGYAEVMIYNVNDLKKVDNKTSAGRIGATVGKRKRNDIITEANKLGIWIFN